MLWNGLVLAIHNIHVQFSFALLNYGAQIGGTLNTVSKRLEKDAESEEEEEIVNSIRPKSNAWLWPITIIRYILSMPFINCFYVAKNHSLFASLQILGHGNVAIWISYFGNVAWEWEMWNKKRSSWVTFYSHSETKKNESNICLCRSPIDNQSKILHIGLFCRYQFFERVCALF